MIYLILALGILFLVVTFLPIQTRQTPTEDPRRLDLQETFELLRIQISEAEAAQDPKALLRTKISIARVLDELEGLPEQQSAAKTHPISTWVVAISLGIFGTLALGVWTFLSAWQQSGLNADDRQQLQLAIQLPELEQRAENGTADLLKYADAQFDLGRYGAASTLYSKALKRNPKQPKALRRFGFLILQIDPKYVSQGLEFMEKSLILDPKSTEGYLLLAAAQNQVGQKEKAIATLQKAQTVDPKNATVQGLLAQLDPKSLIGDSGQRLYGQYCSSCHGKDGTGLSAPSLKSSPLLADSKTLSDLIQKGKGAMPGFPNLTGQNLETLVTFVQSLK